MQKWMIATGIAVVMASNVQAKAPYFLPELVQIARVPVGDTLNVRAQPSGKSADLGDLKNGDRVEILTVQGNWGRILWGEGNGWISLSFADRIKRPTLASGLPVGLNCAGTEPFWSLRLLKLGVAYLNGASLPISKSGSSANSSIGYYFTAPETTGVLYRGFCSDGMSERDYGWKIDLVTPRGMLSGCCSGDKF